MGREKRNFSLGLADPDLLAAGLGCAMQRETTLRTAASPHGWAIARPWLEHCVPQYERESDKLERIIWDSQGNEAFTK